MDRLKIVADIADASATVDLGRLPTASRPPISRPGAPLPPWSARPRWTPSTTCSTRRLDLARAYARAHGLNRVVSTAPDATLGILASGTGFAVVQRALADLGVDEAAMDALGLRLIKLAMPFPLDPAELAAMTGDLERVLVVEDKLPFLEAQLKRGAVRPRARPPP